MNPSVLAALKSYLRAFSVAALVAFQGYGSDPWALDATAWHAILVAGIAAVAAPLLRALDLSDEAFGLTR